MAEKKIKKILVAEDEKPMARAMELKLSHAGFETTCVNNGADALAAILKSDFDMVLLDLVMPKMDGFTVLEELKNKKKLVPVIVLSNLSQEEDEKKAKALGAKDFMIKSNTPIADIVNRINQYFSEK